MVRRLLSRRLARDQEAAARRSGAVHAHAHVLAGGRAGACRWPVPVDVAVAGCRTPGRVWPERRAHGRAPGRGGVRPGRRAHGRERRAPEPQQRSMPSAACGWPRCAWQRRLSSSRREPGGGRMRATKEGGRTSSVMARAMKSARRRGASGTSSTSSSTSSSTATKPCGRRASSAAVQQRRRGENRGRGDAPGRK